MLVVHGLVLAKSREKSIVRSGQQRQWCWHGTNFEILFKPLNASYDFYLFRHDVLEKKIPSKSPLQDHLADVLSEPEDNRRVPRFFWTTRVKKTDSDFRSRLVLYTLSRRRPEEGGRDGAFAPL